ncbi:hypothetical protein [Euzebya rosea]|uniref:hypothetical protein n=1 Tax=Euzebya rosea TaxID=2052804 RepID=UPI000DF14D20|nr:hypothetical protein [Euzebya rosea]
MRETPRLHTLLVRHRGEARTLTRLLLAVDGRACTVLGCATPDPSTVVLWVEVPGGRLDHVLAAVRRTVGLTGLAVARPAPATAVTGLRTHLDAEGVVDVSLAREDGGVTRRGAGDGTSVADAIRAALVASGATPSDREVWLLVHPLTRRPTAVRLDTPDDLDASDDEEGTLTAWVADGPSPVGAVADVLLAGTVGDGGATTGLGRVSVDAA